MNGRDRVRPGPTAVVVGGGIAGIAAATVLAERGVEVTLLERERYLGGRAGAWTDWLEGGESFEMERGFHAFFRNYYNLRSLLRRVDPELDILLPLDDYPIFGPSGRMQSFARLPRRTPFNIAALTARTPTMGAADLMRVNVRRALEMLAFDQQRTYARYDSASAGEYLDSLRFPDEARQLLFNVFAHSFFNPEKGMSAAELLMMFHFYFTGNPEGLIFDVARAPFSTALWEPFTRYLTTLGVRIRSGETAREIRRAGPGGWRIGTDRGSVVGETVVLAVTVTDLKRLTTASPDLNDEGWRGAVAGLATTLPFAVWRLWLDRPTDGGRAPFVGTTGFGALDNISLYHLFEDESRDWAARHGGAVVELHAYAIPESYDEEELRAQLLSGLHELYPETREATILHERFLVRQDCPAFGPDSDATRPGVETPFDGVVIAGDLVKLPFPSALMERAAASGFLAANHLLARWGVRSEPIRSVSRRGLLAALPL